MFCLAEGTFNNLEAPGKKIIQIRFESFFFFVCDINFILV